MQETRTILRFLQFRQNIQSQAGNLDTSHSVTRRQIPQVLGKESKKLKTDAVFVQEFSRYGAA
jgi:hypothetical protein